MERMQGLTRVAGLLALAVVAYYGWVWLSIPRQSSAQELASAALHAATPEEREQAAIKLSMLGKPAHDLILQVLHESRQDEVRGACIRGLAQQWDYRSMPLLLDLLDDPSESVRVQASGAIQHLARIDSGFRAVSGKGKESERREVIKRIRADWEDFRTGIGRSFIHENMGEDL